MQEKINWITSLRGIACLMVVMIHSYNADMFLTLPASSPGGRTVWAFEHILADVLGPVAVPGFFMISAYQFYRNCSFQDVVPKMERRIRTMLMADFIRPTAVDSE